jgi:hypothetical protein
MLRVTQIILGFLIVAAACGPTNEDYGPDIVPPKTPDPIIVKGPIPHETALKCVKGTYLTYENFGAAFLSAHCRTCHSRSVTGPNRNGAPLSANFDSAQDASLYRGSILTKTQGTNPSMPPGLYLSTKQKGALAEWLDCGAPTQNTQ